jgi:hypothetical protein
MIRQKTLKRGRKSGLGGLTSPKPGEMKPVARRGHDILYGMRLRGPSH